MPLDTSLRFYRASHLLHPDLGNFQALDGHREQQRAKKNRRPAQHDSISHNCAKGRCPLPLLSPPPHLPLSFPVLLSLPSYLIIPLHGEGSLFFFSPHHPLCGGRQEVFCAGMFDACSPLAHACPAVPPSRGSTRRLRTRKSVWSVRRFPRTRPISIPLRTCGEC